MLRLIRIDSANPVQSSDGSYPADAETKRLRLRKSIEEQSHHSHGVKGWAEFSMLPSATTDVIETQESERAAILQPTSPSITRSLGFGRSRYSTRRQLQNAICLISVVTQTIIDRQKMQPSDRISRLIVHRGILIESGFSNDSFMHSLSAERRKP